MPHYRSIDEVSLPACWLTIGVFDGIHRGHQKILNQLTQGAHTAGLPAVVLTFDPHPARVLGGRDIKLLTTPDERAETLLSSGVDIVITMTFDKEVAALNAQEFMQHLHRQIGVQRLLIGYDFALGRGREGNAVLLNRIGQDLGYSLEVVDAVGDESGVISSSAIRKLISVGDIAEANKLLGHPYHLTGPVIH